MGTTRRQRGSKHDYPESATVIKDYATIKEIARAFAFGQLTLLVLLGSPGKGKGQIIKRAMDQSSGGLPKELYDAVRKSLGNILATLTPSTPVDVEKTPSGQKAVTETPVRLGPGLYIKGYITPIKFHIEVYKHRDAPITIDDADVFFSDAQLRERTKHLTETDKYKKQDHNSLTKELIAAEVPQVFFTTSPVCIIRNVWDTDDHICAAIESRGTFVVFDPSWAEVYNYIGEWFWDQEIFDYLWEKLPLLREPDIRIVLKAYDLKVANVAKFPWQTAIDQHLADPAYLAVAEFIGKEFKSEEQRIGAWIEAVKKRNPQAAASRATWHRYRADVERAWQIGERPTRIVLKRTERPEEERPPDSPIAKR